MSNIILFEPIQEVRAKRKASDKLHSLIKSMGPVTDMNELTRVTGMSKSELLRVVINKDIDKLDLDRLVLAYSKLYIYTLTASEVTLCLILN